MIDLQRRHETVLADEAIQALHIKPEGLYVDATFGRGGHSRAILNQLQGGRLMVIDKDPDAIHMATLMKEDGEAIEIKHGSFAQLENYCEQMNWAGRVDGVLFDLGVSSPQLDDASRGFSFMQNGPLDMRMDPTSGQSAADWLNSAKAEDITFVLKAYGEERFAKRIAHAIVEARKTKPLETTQELVDIILKAQPIKDKHKHGATRCFQAIRIFINNELDDIHQAISQAVRVLKKGGRLVVISFHSLEDRSIKRALKAFAMGKAVPHFIPQSAQDGGDLKLLGKQKPSDEEIKHNPRARSAMMRVAEKIK